MTPDLIESRVRRFARWIAAGIVVLGVHVGAASYALMAWEDETEAETSGAIAVEIALEMTSDMEQPLDLPPGPMMEESQPTVAAAQQEVESKPEEIPVEDLPSPAPEPEVVLPKQTTATEEPEEVKEEAPQERAVIAAEPTQAAPQTTAPPPVDAPVANKAAAPEQGSKEVDTRSILSWQKSVAMHLNKHKRYPAAARARGIEGEALVRFLLDRSGQVSGVEVTRTSGSPLLDAETAELLKRAAPLPRPPTAVVGELLEFNVPVRYRLKE
jgi:protein TonB